MFHSKTSSYSGGIVLTQAYHSELSSFDRGISNCLNQSFFFGCNECGRRRLMLAIPDKLTTRHDQEKAPDQK